MPKLESQNNDDLIIDLCCGLGRFPGTDVISIDIDPKVKPTIVADIRYLPLRKGLKPKLVHASPPCKYFSQANINRHGHHEKGIADSLRLVAACFDAFYELEPKTWTLENPAYFLRRIIPKTTTIKMANKQYRHKATDFFSNNRALARALIPQDIRQKILDVATSSQQQLEQ